MAESKDYRIKIEGQLVPVSEEIYLAYYRMKRRELYLEEKDMAHGVFSYNALDTEDINGEDVISNFISPLVEDIVENKLIIEKLYQCLAQLTKEEKALIFALYFQNKSQHQYSKETCIPQMTICSRKDKILSKLKKLMER